MSEAASQAAMPPPLPAMQGSAGEFYGWCRQHELRFQRCTDCGTWRHVPREMCAGCGSQAWAWERSSGRGTVFSWTVAARPMHPAFAARTPYAPVIVEMDEGVRLLSEVVDCAPEELVIGMPVEVTFAELTPEISLPKFRRRAA